MIQVANEFYYHVDLNMSWLQIQPTVCTSCNEVYAIHEVSVGILSMKCTELKYKVGEYEGVRGGAMSRWEWEKDHLVRQEWVGTGFGPAHILVSSKCHCNSSNLNGFPRLTWTPAWHTRPTTPTGAGRL